MSNSWESLIGGPPAWIEPLGVVFVTVFLMGGSVRVCSLSTTQFVLQSASISFFLLHSFKIIIIYNESWNPKNYRRITENIP